MMLMHFYKEKKKTKVSDILLGFWKGSSWWICPWLFFSSAFQERKWRLGRCHCKSTRGVAQREPKSVMTDGSGPAPEEAVVSKEGKSLINGCRSEPIPPSQGDLKPEEQCRNQCQPDLRRPSVSSLHSRNHVDVKQKHLFLGLKDLLINFLQTAPQLWSKT